MITLIILSVNENFSKHTLLPFLLNFYNLIDDALLTNTFFFFFQIKQNYSKKMAMLKSIILALSLSLMLLTAQVESRPSDAQCTWTVKYCKDCCVTNYNICFFSIGIADSDETKLKASDVCSNEQVKCVQKCYIKFTVST